MSARTSPARTSPMCTAPVSASATTPAAPKFFRTGDAFSAWLSKHHATTSHLIVGIYRKDTGRGGMLYPAALDAALCHGWIDGVRGTLPGGVHTIRFSPRRTRSIWSQVNLRHMDRLIAAGRVTPHGMAVFKARDPNKTYIYSIEQRPKALPPAFLRRFRAQRNAWVFFTAQPPYYQRAIIFWIVGAKREETRESRLVTAIADATAGRWIKGMKRAEARGRKPAPKTGQ